MTSGVVSQLLEQKCSEIRLGVVTENKRALNFYQSAGFEVTGEFQYYEHRDVLENKTLSFL